MTDINKEYEKEYYDEYRNNYYNPDDDDGEPGINLNWKRIQKGFHSVAGKDQETAETLSGMQATLETLGTDVETLKTDVDDIKESIDDLNTAVETAEQAAEAAAASEAAAEAAQAAIEDIAESIPADYTELSDDVAELKNATKLEELVKYEFTDIIQGSYSNSSTDPDKWVTNANRIRTAGMIPVYSGMVLSFTPGSNASYLLYGKFNIAKNLIADSQWVSTASDININWDGYIICVFKNGSAGTTAISPSDYDAKIVFHSITDEMFDNVDNKIAGLGTTLNHITENNKNLLPVWNKTTSPANVTATYTAGKLKLYGTSNGGYVSYDYSACGPITLPAGTYTFSRGAASTQEILRKVTGTSTTNVAVLQGSTNSVTFTLSEETTLYLYVGFRDGESYDVEIPLQLETGSSATYWVIPKLSAIDVFARENAEHKTRLSLEWTSGKAFIYNAGWSNNSGWSYADLILSQGEAIIVGIDVSTSVYPLSVWSDDGNSIIKACFPLSDTAEYKTLTYVCSADKERVRINVQNTNKANVIAEKYNVGNLLNESNMKAGKNDIPCYDVLYDSIIAIGDSLTQGSYTGSDLHTSQSYPAFLSKTMGNNVENAGRAGWTTLQWWEGDSTSQKGFPYYSYGNYDAAVICLGTNSGLTDTLATDVDPYDDYHDYADTNTGAYCKIIEGMLAQNSGLIIFLCNIWAGGGTGGVSVTNDVIGKIAAKYGLPVIDLKSELMTAYSVYHAVSGNIHLGRIGYAKMAGIIRESLNDYVMTNPAKFNYIPD